MAIFWIKVEHSTPDKPEIDRLASILKIDHDAAFGKCMRFWIWADQQSANGDALGVTKTFLDRLTCCPGFASALIEVGWLASKNGVLSIPNFDSHNGQSAKRRALTSRRMQKARDARGVTIASPDKNRVDEDYKGEAPLKPPRAGQNSTKRKKPLTVDEIAVPPELATQEAMQALGEWLAHHQAIRKPYRDPAYVAKLLAEYVAKGPAAFVEAVNHSIANNYTGLYPPKGIQRERPKQPGVDYDPDDRTERTF